MLTRVYIICMTDCKGVLLNWILGIYVREYKFDSYKGNKKQKIQEQSIMQNFEYFHITIN